MNHLNHSNKKKENESDGLLRMNPFSTNSSTTNVRNRRSPTHSIEPPPVFRSMDSFVASHHHRSDFLEYETTPDDNSFQTVPDDDDDADADDLLGMTGLEGLTTTSGLLLTHRQVRNNRTSYRSPITTIGRDRISSNNYHSHRTLEMDWVFNESQRTSQALQSAKRILSLTHVWIGIGCFVFVIGTAIAWHSSHGERLSANRVNEAVLLSSSTGAKSVSSGSIEHIILVPLPTNASIKLRQGQLSAPVRGVAKPEKGTLKRALRELRQEFEEWVVTHDKSYHSHDEKERRFHIWKENHFKTQEKNDRHGPCKMTNTPVFGSNMFKDLSPQEFQSRYLTGYKGPRTDQLHHHKIQQAAPASVLDPKAGPLHSIYRHPSVQEKYRETLLEDDLSRRLGFSASYSGGCTWYDVSCWLRLFVKKYGYRIGGTMEPKYDANTYPSAVDWRNMGIVTSIHSQGNCGACWAITAVETIESAYAMHTGKLYDLAESEVIICDDTCDLCEGGWPQNAYDYVMKHKGLPLEKSMSYNGDYLLELTYAKTGDSSSYNYQTVMQNTCPSGGSNDEQGNARYGNIAGYGYSTDRCVCYTDGTGCNCDNQDEKLALQNVATYGPATVCLEASLWQDYTGGIITSDLGCSSGFMDMNHCVQAVGYAFTDGSNNDNNNDDKKNSRSRDGKNDKREGYWIIRNQWSENWGMYGYAYVAMGSNTCGVLNDMTNVYMKD